MNWKWSTWGRAHPETSKILEDMARLAARRRGLRDHRRILRRTQAAIGVQLMRRAVAMLLACMPHLIEAEEQLVFEHSDTAPTWPQLREIRLCSGAAEAVALVAGEASSSAVVV